MLVMSVLAIVILLIAAFNYVLISVASLARRAKAVGVHKCSGATGGAVFLDVFHRDCSDCFACYPVNSIAHVPVPGFC